MSQPFTLLSTRPLDAASMAAMQQAGVSVDVAECIRTIAVQDASLTQQVQALAAQQRLVIFTSMNAVEAVAPMLQGLQPVWQIACIGQTTLQLVQQHFANSKVVATGSDALDLAKQIVALPAKDGAVFFCSNIRRHELPDYLQQHGVPLQELVVYHTHEVPLHMNKPYDAVLFFSPSAVRSFFAVNSVPHTTALFAIGSTTAQALQTAGYSNIVVANAAGKEAMIETFLNWYAASQKPVE